MHQNTVVGGTVMEYVALARHSAESCPGSNARVNEWTQQMGPKREALAKKHQVVVRSSHVLSPTHLLVLVLDAPSIESARDFLEESGVTHWNDVDLYPSMSMEERQEMAAKMAIPHIW